MGASFNDKVVKGLEFFNDGEEKVEPNFSEGGSLSTSTSLFPVQTLKTPV